MKLKRSAVSAAINYNFKIMAAIQFLKTLYQAKKFTAPLGRYLFIYFELKDTFTKNNISFTLRGEYFASITTGIF